MSYAIRLLIMAMYPIPLESPLLQEITANNQFRSILTENIIYIFLGIQPDLTQHNSLIRPVASVKCAAAGAGTHVRPLFVLW
jgi:hypothetical protein